ncbi:hypothetical protein QA640_09295 [Bradyrhizobium sp. CB82]|uniref:hypothetical protein n=1 Tax=Bradyrhizobium sp. CB82 TaxID=3039159 RepID=UPI0024B0881C|nr:hypothetical protein [Bradyrhizobium sp. CB82]WFU42629.1 hypothetical protein QA640_09295 [Bradyrhizobium sp. CB82]
MAKQAAPPTRDRYRIVCETDTDEDMGRVIGALTRMGFKNIGFELITDVVTFNRNAPTRPITSEAFALAWLEANPTFALTDLVAHFKADNRTPSSAYYAVKKLADAGKVRKLDGGNYQRADVAAIEAPPPKAAEPKHERTHREEIERFIARRKTFTTAQLRELFREQGRNEVSVSPILDKMMNAKIIKRSGAAGSGEYEVVKRPAAKKPATKLNGVSQGEMTNAQ